MAWTFFGFVALQLTFFPASMLWPPIQDGEYGHKIVNLRNHLKQKPADRPAIVMFGSSLTGWGLNPGAMSNVKAAPSRGAVVYNFGINSSGVMVELACLKRLLNAGIRPDLVLIETHPWFLFEGYNHVHDKHHFFPVNRTQLQDFSVFMRYDANPTQLVFDWAWNHVIPWYDHRHDLQNTLLPKWVPREKRIGVWDYTDQHGWEGGLTSQSTPLTPAEVLASAKYHVEAMSYAPIFPESERAFREIVAVCREAKIPVTLVRMPEMTVMREGPPAFTDKVEKFYADLHKDTKVRIIDARAWADDAHFTDGFHLYPPGSIAFSTRLERELVTPFVASFAPSAGTNLIR
ncbi:MAG: hypothetical protein C0483_03020 [Pirellula sp.]|nr:hypothetical protein [Pirellula sp.]